jgi:hypothetical protein
MSDSPGIFASLRQLLGAVADRVNFAFCVALLAAFGGFGVGCLYTLRAGLQVDIEIAETTCTYEFPRNFYEAQ